MDKSWLHPKSVSVGCTDLMNTHASKWLCVSVHEIWLISWMEAGLFAQSPHCAPIHEPTVSDVVMLYVIAGFPVLHISSRYCPKLCIPLLSRFKVVAFNALFCSVWPMTLNMLTGKNIYLLLYTICRLLRNWKSGLVACLMEAENKKKF